ncbi:MAG: gamma-glutamylcyclotransferase family protein [Pseudomonadota bacterium]
MNDAAGALVGYFGFGSLVNPNTLRTNYIESVPATLKGWKRHWESRNPIFKNEVALLSIHKNDDTDIKGMVVIDQLSHLAQVDERETGYSRVKLRSSDLVLHTEKDLPEALYVYVADTVDDEPGSGPLLQSYLDAVMQGFYLNFEEEGVRHFVDTTHGFARPIIADRQNPRYPRHVQLSLAECDLFDRELARAGVIKFP